MNSRTRPLAERAVIYIRISKDSERKGMGVARQLKLCNALADQLGWTVADVLEDNDLSAWKEDTHRPAYEKLLNGIRDGDYDGVLCWATDRLYRRVSDLIELIPLINRRHVPVEADLEGAINLSTAAGRKQAIDLANAAEFESARKSERIRDQRDEAAADGKWQGGRRPRGYEADGVTLHPVEAPLIRQAVTDVLEGISLNAARKPLEALGMNRSTFGRVLRSPRIAGLRVHRGEVLGKAEWPAIVDRESWEALQHILADPKRKKSRPGRTYLLAGLVYSHDGHRLAAHPSWSRGRRTRRYLARIPADNGGFDHVSVSADPLEDFVIDAFLSRKVADASALIADDKSEAIRTHIAALEDELGALDRVREQDLISIEQWAAESKRIRTRMQALRAEMPTERTPRVIDDLFSLPPDQRKECWGSMTFEQKRVALAHRIARVVVRRVGRPGRGFDTGRVSIDWR